MYGRLNLMKAVAFLVLGLLGMTLADKSAGCGKTATIRSQTYTTTVNSKQRQYVMKLPENYDKDRAYRLIFAWHPRGGSATKLVNGEDIHHGGALPYYGLPPLSNNSAIFVVPNGLNSGWANAGGEDVTFFDDMVKAIEAGLCVDTKLIFSTGFSYGGAMSYSLACSRSNVLRAVVVLSGGMLSGCAGGDQPVAYYGQHGTSDSVLNVSGGRSMRDKFVKNNGCTPVTQEPQPEGAKSVKTVYKGCKEGFPVTWVIHKGDHNPSEVDNGSSQPFAPGNTWEFLSQFN